MFRRILICLLFSALAAASAQAHDLLTGNTDLGLRPDALQVDFVVARVVAKSLLEHPPADNITDENFDGVFQPLLQPAAAGLFILTIDGKTIVPQLTEVVLSEETDVRFTWVFTRPPGGRLALAAPVIKKLPDGFVNNIAMKEGGKVLAYGEQRDGDPPWAITLAAPPAPAPLAAPATAADEPEGDKPFDDDLRLSFWGYVIIGLSAFVIFLYCERLRRGRTPAKTDPGV